MNIKNNVSAVIFDCDGVMFESRQANVNYYNSLLAHFNLPLMNKKDEAFVHMHTADESVRHIFRKTSVIEEAQAYRMTVDYTPFIMDMIMEPGLKDLLRILKPEFGLAVATNRSNTIGDVLAHHGLKEFFDMVVSSLDVQIPKPHPEALYKILDRFQISPEQSIYVGDSLVDYETAKAGGVPFIAYKNSGLEADYHVDHLMDIAGSVLGIGSGI